MAGRMCAACFVREVKHEEGWYFFEMCSGRPHDGAWLCPLCKVGRMDDSRRRAGRRGKEAR